MVEGTVLARETGSRASSWQAFWEALRASRGHAGRIPFDPALVDTSITIFSHGTSTLIQAIDLDQLTFQFEKLRSGQGLDVFTTSYDALLRTALAHVSFTTFGHPAQIQTPIDAARLITNVALDTSRGVFQPTAGTTVTPPGFGAWEYGIAQPIASTMSQQSVDIPTKTAILSLLLQRIKIPDPAGVRSYLRDHPDMVTLVLRACRLAADRFTEDHEISLELYNDPEIDGQYLIIYVRANIYQDNMMDIIDNLSDELSGQISNISGWLSITTDFQTPRQ